MGDKRNYRMLELVYILIVIVVKWLYTINKSYQTLHLKSVNFSLCKYTTVVQSLSHVQLFATLWTAARQASLSITNSQNLLKLMSIEWMMPSNHLILCRPLLLLPWIFSSIRVFWREGGNWQKCWPIKLTNVSSTQAQDVNSYQPSGLNLASSSHSTPSPTKPSKQLLPKTDTSLEAKCPLLWP